MDDPGPRPQFRGRRFWSYPEMIVTAAIVMALLAAAISLYGRTRHRHDEVNFVSSLKQIHLAAFSMANDYEVDQDPKLGWPGDLALSNEEPVTTLAGFAERLVKYDYLKRSDLAIFSGPGTKRYPGTGPFTSQYSEYKIYRVRELDCRECLFGAPRNFTFGRGLDPGTKGAVICRKGGDVLPLDTAKEALRKDLGCMPGHLPGPDPGEETPESILKM